MTKFEKISSWSLEGHCAELAWNTAIDAAIRLINHPSLHEKQDIIDTIKKLKS